MSLFPAATPNVTFGSRNLVQGEPGAKWTNDRARVHFQLIVDWSTCCGLCAQFDHKIGPYWPIPFHPNCRCRQLPIPPGGESRPFVDFGVKIAAIKPAAQARICGRSNLKLIEAGVVKWTDVVTSNRIRSLREVVARGKISVETMTRAGVVRHIAEEAHASVNTPAHQIASDDAAQAIGELSQHGVSKQAAIDAVAKRLAGNLSSNLPPPPPPPPPPPAAGPTPPKPPTPRGEGPTPATKPFAPSGKPVSSEFKIPSGRLAPRVRAALDQIDGVHGDGSLPSLQVRYNSSERVFGSFGALSRCVTISRKGPHPELTVVHEVGHAIEAFGLPGRKGALRDWPVGITSAWFDAVTKSLAFDKFALVAAASIKAKGPITRDLAAYFLSEDELWARSYSQYIALRAADGVLWKQLKSDPNGLRLGLYWEHGDFAPIMQAFDALFLRLGWRVAR